MGILLAIGVACSSGDSAKPRGSGRKEQAGNSTGPVPSSEDRRGPSPIRKSADSIIGKVVGVSDGDTIVVYDVSRGGQFKIRLATIDCPEKTQDFGVRAKESMSSMVFGRQVEVEVRSTDRYGRSVGVVRIDGTDVNLEQIKRGFAWHYTQYSSEQPRDEFEAYAAAERDARSRRVGLWVDADPVPPWSYRRAKRRQSSYAE